MMFEPGRLLGHFPENVDGAQHSPNILHLSPGLIMMVIRMSMMMAMIQPRKKPPEVLHPDDVSTRGLHQPGMFKAPEPEPITSK